MSPFKHLTLHIYNYTIITHDFNLPAMSNRFWRYTFCQQTLPANNREDALCNPLPDEVAEVNGLTKFFFCIYAYRPRSLWSLCMSVHMSEVYVRPFVLSSEKECNKFSRNK